MRSIFLSCVLMLILATSAHGKLLAADQVREPQTLLPYFTWLIDPEGKHNIASVTSGGLQERFAPLANGIPLKSPGAVWLRLVLVKSPPSPLGDTSRGNRPRLVMNLGELPPGGAQMFIAEPPGPVSTQGTWRSEHIAPHSDTLLPEPGLTPVSVYLRLESMPGLWFNPSISAQGYAKPGLVPPALLLLGLLVVACFACLLRALAHRAQWALWAGLFLGCVLAQVLLPLPAPDGNLNLRDLPAALVPGMALVLLPHVARCMFRTNILSTIQDSLLYFCSIIGVAVCLVPLLPDKFWLTRLFPLWPLLLAPLLPVCLSALAGKRPGALSFTGACVMPLLGACLTLYAIDKPSLHPLAAQGSFWGLAVGGLGLALARIPKVPAKRKKEEEEAAMRLADKTDGAAPKNPEARKEGYGPLPSLDKTTAALQVDLSRFKQDPASRTGASFENDQDNFGWDGSESGAATEKAVPSATGAEEAATPEAGTAARTDAEKAAAPAQSDAPEAKPETPAESGAGAPADAPESPQEPATPMAAPVQQDAADGPDGRRDTPPAGLSADTADLPPPAGSAQANAEQTADGPDQAAATTAAGPAAFAEQSLPAASGTAPGEAESSSLPGVQSSDSDTPQVPLTPQPGGPLAPDAGSTVDERYAGLLPDFAASSDATETPEEASRVISLVDEDFSDYSTSILEDLQEEPLRHTTMSPNGEFLFNLHSLVREVHDIVVPLAKNKGLLFSWYITPSLPTLLEGDAPRLRGALSLLLQNAVQATQRGAVQLAVRKNPGGGEPGDLLFSISDSGSAQRTDAGFFHAWELAARTGGSFTVEYAPGSGTQISFTARFALPSEQSAHEHFAGLAKAVQWDAAPLNAEADISLKEEQESGYTKPLAPLRIEETVTGKDALEGDPDFDDNDEPISILWERTAPSALSREEPAMAAMSPEEVLEAQGFLEPSPKEGEEPSPEARTGFRPLASTAQQETAPVIVAAEMTNSKRRLLAHYLEGLPHEHVDAANNSQVVALVRERQVSLAIFDADMPEPDIIKTLGTLRQEERKRGQAVTPVLVLTGHDVQSERMRKAGASHCLRKPFTRESLCEAVMIAAPALAALVPSVAAKAKDTSSSVPDQTREDAGPGRAPAKQQDSFVDFMRSTGKGGLSPDAPYAGDPSAPVSATEARKAQGAKADDEKAGQSAPEAKSTAAAAPAAETNKTIAPATEDITPDASVAEAAIIKPDAAMNAKNMADAETSTPTQETAATDNTVTTPPPASDAEKTADADTNSVTPDAPAADTATTPSAPVTDTTLVAEAQETTPDNAATEAASPAPAPATSAQSAAATTTDGTSPSLPEQENPAPIATDTDLAVDSDRYQKTVDLLEAALRDAPVQQGEALLVSLPPVNANFEPPKRSAPAAAPMILGLSQEDVTPFSYAPSAKVAEAPLLDWIITDDNAAQTDEAETASPPDAAVTPEADAAPEMTSDSQTAVPQETRAEQKASPAAVPSQHEEPSSDLEKDAAAQEAIPDTAAPENASRPDPPATPDKVSVPKVQVFAGKLSRRIDAGTGTVIAVPKASRAPAPAAAKEEPPAPATPSQPENITPSSPAPQVFPLPGMDGEFLDASVIPLVPGLVSSLQEALADAKEASNAEKSILVQEAAGRLAGKADSFGLQKLGKIGRCVERAAEADDMEAVVTLLEDLDIVTKRYLISLDECFQSFSKVDT